MFANCIRFIYLFNVDAKTFQETYLILSRFINILLSELCKLRAILQKNKIKKKDKSCAKSINKYQ